MPGRRIGELYVLVKKLCQILLPCSFFIEKSEKLGPICAPELSRSVPSTDIRHQQLSSKLTGENTTFLLYISTHLYTRFGVYFNHGFHFRLQYLSQHMKKHICVTVDLTFSGRENSHFSEKFRKTDG